MKHILLFYCILCIQILLPSNVAATIDLTTVPVWESADTYVATGGALVDLDPALLVTPPKGMEVGYVPIATRQEWGGSTTHACGH